jgi:hypothetical protein
MLRLVAAQGKPSDGPRGAGPAGEATDGRDLVRRPAAALAYEWFSVDHGRTSPPGLSAFMALAPYAGSGRRPWPQVVDPPQDARRH